MAQDEPSGKKAGNKSQNTATAEGHGESTKADSDDRFQFERLIAGFSSTIIEMPIEDLKEGMGIWLEQFARFLGVDRIAVSEMGKDGHSWAHFQSYSDPSLSLPPIAPLVDIKPAMPAIESALKRGEIFVIESVLEDLPATDQPLPLVKEGTKSFISMALASKEEIVGIFIIAMFRHEMKWSEDHIRRVKLIGEIIANALVRRRSRLHLAKETNKRRSLENRYLSILKTANVGFWITDLHHTIIEVNDAYCAMTGYSREELLSRSIADIDVDNGPKILAEQSTQILRMKRTRNSTGIATTWNKCWKRRPVP